MKKAFILAIVTAVVAVVVVSWPRGDKPELSYVAIGIDENRSPVAIGINIRNDSNADVEVAECTAAVTWSTLVTSGFTPDTLPASLSSETTFVDDPPIVIPANSTAVVRLYFRWKLNPSDPPAVAACQIVPVLKTKTGTIPTEPIAFIVTHNADAGGVRREGIEVRQVNRSHFVLSRLDRYLLC